MNLDQAGAAGASPGRWTVDPDIIVRRTGNTAVIVDLRTSKIFELNPVAVRVWDLLAEVGDESALVSRLAGEFDADAGELQRDVEALLARLQQEQLISRA